MDQDDKFWEDYDFCYECEDTVMITTLIRTRESLNVTVLSARITL